MNTRFVSFLFLTLTPAAMFARDKTDVIVMTNGDRFTCEIKNLQSGVLYASLDYVDGTISISWPKVDRVESSQLFVVQTESGMTYTGTLKTVEEPGDKPRSIRIADNQQGRGAVVDQSTMVVADQSEDSFWRRLHGSLGLGFIYTKSSDTTQYNLSSGASYRKERISVDLSYSSAFSNASGANTTTRNQVDLKGTRILRWDNWFYSGDVSYLQNSAQGISAQTLLGGTIGRYLKHTNSSRFGIEGGLAVQNTEYTSRPAEHDLVAVFGGELYIFRFKKQELIVKPILLPNLSNAGRVRFNLNAQYKLQIISNLWWNITLYGNWDSRPPAGLVGSDYGTSMGVNYSFH